VAWRRGAQIMPARCNRGGAGGAGAKRLTIAKTQNSETLARRERRRKPASLSLKLSKISLAAYRDDRQPCASSSAGVAANSAGVLAGMKLSAVEERSSVQPAAHSYTDNEAGGSTSGGARRPSPFDHGGRGGGGRLSASARRIGETHFGESRAHKTLKRQNQTAHSAKGRLKPASASAAVSTVAA